MMARILRLVLALQLLVVAALCLVFARFWHIGRLAMALPLALAIVIVARALITAHNFFLSWHYPSATPVQDWPPLWGRCRMFAEEFTASMLGSSWTMAWPTVRSYIAADACAPSVLLIHGYGCNGGYWRQLSAVLRKARISHDVIDLEPVAASIDDYVPQVQCAVQRLCQESGSSKIIIVGHSMGGLVARAYLRVHGSAHVARVITLGTPHHGTGLASFGIGLNAMQMRRGAPDAGGGAWLTTLADGEGAAQRALFTSIFSHHDNIIAPQTSCYLPGAKNIEFGGIGHVALGRNRRILQCVLDEILLARAGAAQLDGTHAVS